MPKFRVGTSTKNRFALKPPAVLPRNSIPCKRSPAKPICVEVLRGNLGTKSTSAETTRTLIGEPSTIAAAGGGAGLCPPSENLGAESVC